MRVRQPWVLAVLLLAACEPPFSPQHQITVLPPASRASASVAYDMGYCEASLRPEEWSVVTWPEMAPVPSLAIPDDGPGPTCRLALTTEMPLEERWYAAQFIGELAPSERTPGAIVLRDGTRVFRFPGVAPTYVADVVTIPWRDHVFLQARVAQDIDPAPGFTWGTIMTVTQGSFSCLYPGTEVIEEGAGIGFFEALAVDCTGIDWTAPVHIHIEGAVARYGLRRPVPVIDVEHTFGASSDSISLSFAAPPSAIPPPAPSEICAEACE